VTAPDDPPDRPRLSRRAALAGSVLGASAIALGALAVVPALAAGQAAAAATAIGSYDFNAGWLFGGAYAAGSERPGYNDRRFAAVTVPHTVVPLSWTGWNYQSWQQRRIYRKHFDGAGLVGHGDRVLLTFDGVMTDATVVLNGVTLGAHAGGYLPFTVELTGRLKAGANVLALIVDGRWLDVPPDALAGGPDTGSRPSC
jgi:beta-galactosidase